VSAIVALLALRLDTSRKMLKIFFYQCVTGNNKMRCLKDGG
jgi:hypothetical protein